MNFSQRNEKLSVFETDCNVLVQSLKELWFYCCHFQTVNQVDLVHKQALHKVNHMSGA